MTLRRERVLLYRAASWRARFSRSTFEQLVKRALEGLPEQFASRLSNVAVIIEDRPDPHKLVALGFDADEALLGLYEGTPLGERGSGYHLAMPDRITIYRLPILEMCRSDEEAVREIRDTVMHEIGHFFGLSDQELESQ